MNFESYVMYKYTFRNLSGGLRERIFILRRYNLFISRPYAAGFIEINKDDPDYGWNLYPVSGNIEGADASLCLHLVAERITPERIDLCGRLVFKDDEVTSSLWQNDKGLSDDVSGKSHIKYYNPSNWNRSLSNNNNYSNPIYCSIPRGGDLCKPITLSYNLGVGLSISNVIFEGPATIVEFIDGDKVVVKKEKDAADDREKAIMYAICQKNCGVSKTKFHKWISETIDDATDKECERILKKHKKKLKKKKE